MGSDAIRIRARAPRARRDADGRYSARLHPHQKLYSCRSLHRTRRPIIELETMPDHVHLLVSCDPQFGIHRLVKQIKGRSSRVLRAEFPALMLTDLARSSAESRLPTLWTNSYFVASVGGATLEAVKRYVENQKDA
ncbi:IS200/IS605 family transposase [Nocardia sp. NPDC057272]|uniref:IS200/IS605 family transposase n=1 Tax=Nocardia sp. NPDC057272 TaxID=3346079 RepID=UPI003635D45F